MCDYMILLTDAYFALGRGRESEGLDILGRAMALGRECGIMTFPYSTPAVMGYLCTKSLEAGIEPEYARELIRKHNLQPDISGIAIEAWPYPIKIYTLGRLEIIKDGEPLLFAGKVQKNPLEMLMALIAFGGRDVPEERLTDALWPEADGDLAHKSFEMTLSRLRRLLGGDNLVKYSLGLLSIDPLYCWVDSLGLEHLFEKIREAPADQVTLLCEKAVGLYKGPFFPASGLQWVVSNRETLKNRLLRIILTTGRHYEQAGQWESAVEYYLKGLDMDSLAEEFYQRLMLCYQQLDRRAEAVKAYKRCLSLFLSELGIEPSDKTKNIYSSILQYKNK